MNGVVRPTKIMESMVGSAKVAFFHYSICLYDCTLLETACHHRLSGAVGTKFRPTVSRRIPSGFWKRLGTSAVSLDTGAGLVFGEKILGQSRDLLVHFPFCSLRF
jgi:hypothetical protein